MWIYDVRISLCGIVNRFRDYICKKKKKMKLDCCVCWVLCLCVGLLLYIKLIWFWLWSGFCFFWIGLGNICVFFKCERRQYWYDVGIDKYR